MMKLDLSWFPLAQFLEDKFKWADMIANTKQIRLSIQDNTVSTAAGIQKLLELSSRDTSTLSTDLVVRDIEGGATIVSSLTYQSPHFVAYYQMGWISASIILLRKIVASLGWSCYPSRNYFYMLMCSRSSNCFETSSQKR
jgi:hypothetical protein